MNADNTTPDQSTGEKTRSRFPRITLCVTILTAIIWAVARLQGDALNEWLNINPGILNLLPYLLAVISGLFWLGWLVFGSGLSKGFAIPLALAQIIGVAGFFYLVQPIFDGDARIVGWQNRLAKRSDFVVAKSGPDSKPAGPAIATTPNDFPQFLGPNRNGRLNHVTLSRDWKTTPPEFVWKQPIGEGWSGFAVVNGNAVTLEQRNEMECVTCYDVNTGELKWIHSEPRRHEDAVALGRAGPRTTPTIFAGKVYALGATGVLDCLNLSDGKLRWTVDLTEILDIPHKKSVNAKGIPYMEEESSLAWGRSGSPLVHNGMVIVPGGGPRDGPFVTLLGFDLETGDEKWRAGKRMIGYGSPSLATIAGVPQILLVTEDAAVGHNATTGEEIWAHERVGSSDGAANTSQVTVVDETHVLLSKGYNMGGELLEIEPNGATYRTKSLWKNPRVLKTKLTSPVVYDGHAYTLSDGYLECTNIEANERKWKKRARYGNGQLLLVNDLLLVHSANGSLYLVEATPEEYTELARIPETINGVCWNTLALYGDLLLVRSELEAACIRLPLLAPTPTTNDSADPAAGE